MALIAIAGDKDGAEIPFLFPQARPHRHFWIKPEASTFKMKSKWHTSGSDGYRSLPDTIFYSLPSRCSRKNEVGRVNLGTHKLRLVPQEYQK